MAEKRCAVVALIGEPQRRQVHAPQPDGGRESSYRYA